MPRMTVQEIEEEMEEIKMLMRIWNDFYRILTTVFYHGDPEARRKLDPEFQKIKTIVAEHHAHLMSLIKKDLHIGQSVLTTVKRTISLDGFASLSPIEVNKTLIEWHDANILLNETLGSLECERDKILRKREEKVPRPPLHKRIAAYMESPAVKLVVFLVVVGIVGSIVHYNWENIRQNEYFVSYVRPFLRPVLALIGFEGIVDLPEG